MDKSLLKSYIKMNLSKLVGMQSMDANHITCIYFLVTTAALIDLPLGSNTEELIKDYVWS